MAGESRLSSWEEAIKLIIMRGDAVEIKSNIEGGSWTLSGPVSSHERLSFASSWRTGLMDSRHQRVLCTHLYHQSVIGIGVGTLPSFALLAKISLATGTNPGRLAVPLFDLVLWGMIGLTSIYESAPFSQPLVLVH